MLFYSLLGELPNSIVNLNHNTYPLVPTLVLLVIVPIHLSQLTPATAIPYPFRFCPKGERSIVTTRTFNEILIVY